MTEPQRSAPQFGLILSKWQEKQGDGSAAKVRRASQSNESSAKRITDSLLPGSDPTPSQVGESLQNRPPSFTYWKEREGSGSKLPDRTKQYNHERNHLTEQTPVSEHTTVDYASPKPSDLRRRFDTPSSGSVPTMFANKGLCLKPPIDTSPHSAPPSVKPKVQVQLRTRSTITSTDKKTGASENDTLNAYKVTPITAVSQSQSQSKSKSRSPNCKQLAAKSVPELPPAVTNNPNNSEAPLRSPTNLKEADHDSSIEPMAPRHELSENNVLSPAAAKHLKRNESIRRSCMNFRSVYQKSFYQSPASIMVPTGGEALIRNPINPDDDKTILLRGISFLKNLHDTDIRKLASLMKLIPFVKDQLLIRRGFINENMFYIIQEGTVICKDITAGQTNYMDQTLGPGEWFGECSLRPTETRQMNVIAQSRGAMYAICRKSLDALTVNLKDQILKAEDARRLAGMRCLRNANLNDRQLAALASVISERKFMHMQLILAQGLKTKIAIYFVRKGEVEITMKGKTEVIKAGGYFGDTYFKDDGTFDASVYCQPSFSVKALTAVLCGVLTLQDARTVFDTALLAETSVMHESFNISFARLGTDADVDDFVKHTILGEGTFGQVWLVSEPQGKCHDVKPFALKIQSKYELAREGQIMAVMEEKKILARIQHPFTCKLIKAFQDSVFVYLLMECVQGGELFSLLHDDEHHEKGFSDEQAKFYAFCLADVFAYIHQTKIVYRDLKPENVMIDHKGYPILIDFGFAKFVPDKTYTLCGTPGYLPPEVISGHGHDCSADHWSLGILIYEMIAGCNPFYGEGMDQNSLFQSIVKDPVEKPKSCSTEATDIVLRLLIKDPTCRLGSLARGEREIKEHPWFKNLDLIDIRHRRVPAPWVPDLKGAFDTSCFEDWSHLEDITSKEFDEISEQEKAMFRGFEDGWDDKI